MSDSVDPETEIIDSAGPRRVRMNPCVLISIYDHGSTIRRVVESVASANSPLVIVNDASDLATREVLDRIAKDFDWVEIRHHAANKGKGAALVTGYRAAAARGFTHAIQLDADAQHEAADVRCFLAAAHANPDALVLGQACLRRRRTEEPSVWPEALGRPGVARDALSRRERPAVRLPLCVPRARTAPSGPRVDGSANGL